MSSDETGNLQRAKWRRKCRQILADHLEYTLRIVVEPAQVRLKPDVQDGYMWNTLSERQYLFTKQLSKHSVGAYLELYREVGESFEAVTQKNLDVSLSDDEIKVG